MVDRDAETAGLLLSNTGELELGEGETATLADLGVVADGGAADSRAERLKGANAEGGRLGLTSLAPAELAAGLVEPGLHAGLESERQQW